MPLQVRAWQAHPIHLEQHDIWANSDRIRALTFTDPAAAAELTYHRSQHVIAAQNAFGLPMPPPPPKPPMDLPKVTLALTSADLMNPMVMQVFNEGGLPLTLPQPAPQPPGAQPGAQPAIRPPARRSGFVHTPGQVARPGAGLVPPPTPPQGAALTAANVNREAGGTHTLPGNPTGAGNMAAPA